MKKDRILILLLIFSIILFLSCSSKTKEDFLGSDTKKSEQISKDILNNEINIEDVFQPEDFKSIYNLYTTTDSPSVKKACEKILVLINWKIIDDESKNEIINIIRVQDLNNAGDIYIKALNSIVSNDIKELIPDMLKLYFDDDTDEYVLSVILSQLKKYIPIIYDNTCIVDNIYKSKNDNEIFDIIRNVMKKKGYTIKETTYNLTNSKEGCDLLVLIDGQLEKHKDKEHEFSSNSFYNNTLK